MQGQSFEIKSNYPRLLLIFRTFKNIEASVKYLDGSHNVIEASEKLSGKNLTYFYLPNYGTITIEAIDSGYVAFTSVALPKECAGRLWISNIPGDSLKLSGGLKWPYTLTKEAVCAVFAYAPEITYSYYTHLDDNDKVNFNDVAIYGEASSSTTQRNCIVKIRTYSYASRKSVYISTSSNRIIEPTNRFRGFVLVGNKFYSSFWYKAKYFPYFCLIILIIGIIYVLYKSSKRRGQKSDPVADGYSVLRNA
ncbi:hypothetical protein GPJ56_002420 [Histomonas meleagridis]|uniref:uncharacterized protein n=1 Tax=Histomonas meleagridis TaxID=135588 RepID=UPI00355AB8FC|nr:hypothetical protein GPJ56_002420 [Histomonas meleagridis]KAH0801849.1 hypothetical protein GO595_005267 [Histomonas meleagridis]